MNRFILASLFAICFATNTNSQCTEMASNFGNNTSTPSYNISGDVSVTLNTNNSITIDLASNFSTASGPDVRVYLINSEGRTDTMLRDVEIADLEHIPFGEISASGMQSFTTNIPINTDISDFDKVFFYCLQFDVFWDVGSITPFSSSNCSVLSLDENNLKNFTILPNPATTSIELTNIDTTNSEIFIFDFYGRTVFRQSKEDNTTINIAHLSTGTYFLRIQEKQNTLSKKLIVQ